ncbi:MAG: element excision factor XisI family protein [Xenococcaceae cyanobacterium MO_167.B27]|nr:element excision factor XisI family protein [Xenococcaceae cyanobacterium MO_167.B27]
MDRVDNYRQIICQFLQDFASNNPEAQLIFDSDSDRFLVIINY